MRAFPFLFPMALVVTLASCGSSVGAREVVLEGEIIDPQCYFTHHATGEAHRPCAIHCGKGGQNFAFLNRAGGKVYPIIAGGHGQNPNDSLYAVVGYPVLVQGTIYEKNGQRVLLVARTERLPGSRAAGGTN